MCVPGGPSYDACVDRISRAADHIFHSLLFNSVRCRHNPVIASKRNFLEDEGGVSVAAAVTAITAVEIVEIYRVMMERG